MAALVALYFLASLAHFVHNAEYIAFYPGMPRWLSADKVYFAWLAVTSIGVAAWVLRRCGLRALAVAFLGVYGAFGLDGLAHYTLALCSEHTIMANVTIWSEAATGLVLLLACAVSLGRRAVHSAQGRVA
jgi:hypothetical protein